MKTTNLKWIALAFSVLMLMQSCVVYQKTASSVNEAIASTKKVKAKTIVGVEYKFDDIVRENDQLYGIAKRYSKTAEMLSQQITDNNLDKEMVKILILENTIKGYYLVDKKKSTVMTLFFPGILLLVIIIASLSTADSLGG